MTFNLFGKGRTKWLPYLGILPGLLLYLIFSVGPSFFTAIFSFTNITAVPQATWKWVGFDNYLKFFSSGNNGRDVLEPLWRTLIFACGVTFIQCVVSLLLAVLLNTRPKYHTFSRSVFFMPVVLGVTIIGLIWNLVFLPFDGPVQKIWGIFGQYSDFLSSREMSFPLIILIQVWSSLGVCMVIFLAGLQVIPTELYEAARLDGANPWKLFRFVTYPLLAPTITVNVLLSLIGALQAFQLIYVLTAGQFNTSVLSLLIFQVAFGNNTSSLTGASQGYAAALAMVQFVLVLIIAFVVLTYLRRKETNL